MKKLTLLISITLCLFLTGCASWRPPKVMAKPISHRARIGVISSLGNEATVLKAEYGLLKFTEKFMLPSQRLNHAISFAIASKLEKNFLYPIEVLSNITNNPIPKETMFDLGLHNDNLTPVEKKYLRNRIRNRKLNYIIMVLPGTMMIAENFLMMHYGIVDAIHSSFPLFHTVKGFYFAYRVLIIDARTFSVLAKQIKGTSKKTPYDFSGLHPKISNKMKKIFERWLIKTSTINVPKVVLSMLKVKR